MEILNNVLDSLGIYFDTLAQFGYKKQTDVNKLIVYNFIGELLTSPFKFFISECDYRSIERALNCLYGSTCLIPYPQYVVDDTLFGEYAYGCYANTRLTEDGTLRHTEDDRLRFKTSNYAG